MLKKSLLALVAGLATAGAMAGNTPDDLFLEKIRFIQYHAPNPVDYRSGTQKLIRSVKQSDGAMLGALGRAFMRLQDYDNALGVLISATRITPSNADAQADLAFVSAMKGPDCETSRTAYRRAVELQPSVTEMRHVQRARALCPAN
ncbi:hypothetical protein WL29_23355 [Burkholderia ubonensis]|uniref:Uncharacterized protein n=1 Tax=Burkholderia ubonensis TaxID=101571 RepID=A0A119HFQ7_9BURK|nr:hypothetical protein [Burkholderia ubonensis]KWA84297.1 hypothetical protein WL29_23355 [Burkholderia ubonensis]